MGFSLGRLKQHLRTPLYANAYFLMGTSAVRSLSGLPFWIIAARLFAPTDVGLASALVSAVMLLATFSTMGLEVGMVRFLSTVNEEPDSFVNSSLTLVALCSATAAVVFLIGLPRFAPALAVIQQQPYLLLSFPLFTIVGAMSIVTDQVFVAHRAARFTFYKNAMSSLLKIFMPLLLVAFSGVMALFTSVWVPVLLALAVSLIYLLPKIQRGYLPNACLRKDLLSHVMRYSLNNHFANVLGALPGSLFPLMVVAALGEETNAYFYAAWIFAQPLFMVSLAVSYSLFAEGSHQPQALAATVRHAVPITFLVLALTAGGVFLLGDKLLLVFGQSYSDHATPLLRLLSVAAFPVAVKLLALAAYRVRMDLSRIVALSALDAGLSIGLVHALMRSFGLYGVGLGVLLSQLVVAAVILAAGWTPSGAERGDSP